MNEPVSQAESPRWDPRFADHWIIDLLTHWGRWRRPAKLAPNALSHEVALAARDARLKAERMGYVIEAQRGLGYRVVDLRMPQRIYLCKPGPQAKEEQAKEPESCQRQLVSEV